MKNFLAVDRVLLPKSPCSFLAPALPVAQLRRASSAALHSAPRLSPLLRSRLRGLRSPPSCLRLPSTSLCSLHSPAKLTLPARFLSNSPKNEEDVTTVKRDFSKEWHEMYDEKTKTYFYYDALNDVRQDEKPDTLYIPWRKRESGMMRYLRTDVASVGRKSNARWQIPLIAVILAGLVAAESYGAVSVPWSYGSSVPAGQPKEEGRRGKRRKKKIKKDEYD